MNGSLDIMNDKGSTVWRIWWHLGSAGFLTLQDRRGSLLGDERTICKNGRRHSDSHPSHLTVDATRRGHTNSSFANTTLLVSIEDMNRMRSHTKRKLDPGNGHNIANLVQQALSQSTDLRLYLHEAKWLNPHAEMHQSWRGQSGGPVTHSW